MTNIEAIAILSNLKAGLKPKEAVAVLKGIQALIEKAQREAKEQKLKEQHKHKCRECANFSFAYGGLSRSLGHCAIKDSAWTDNRQASCRACKDFIADEEANEDE